MSLQIFLFREVFFRYAPSGFLVGTRDWNIRLTCTTAGADAAWHDDEWEAQPKAPAARAKAAPAQRPDPEPAANDEWGKW